MKHSCCSKSKESIKQEHNETFLVVISNARTNPGTMMIESERTSTTCCTMMTARWFECLAFSTMTNKQERILSTFESVLGCNDFSVSRRGFSFFQFFSRHIWRYPVCRSIWCYCYCVPIAPNNHETQKSVTQTWNPATQSAQLSGKNKVPSWCGYWKASSSSH